jgi:LysR family glycine cleavage system transcriptional activator
MKRKLPPLNALKAFDAAARNLSFTKAAQELFLTPGAVSRQVKILEEYLKESLFIRINKGLILTKKAQLYHHQIEAALELIRISTNSAYDKTENNNFSISILPSLSSYWMIKRIQYLKKYLPEINLRIMTGGENEINFTKLGVDIAIRVSDKKFSDVKSIWLMTEEMLLIGNPALNSKLKKISDISQFSFFDNFTRPQISRTFLRSIGIDIADFKEVVGLEHFFMMIESVKISPGFALVPNFLVEEDLKKNLLINPFQISYKTNSSYYLLYPQENQSSPKLKKFIKYFQESLNDSSNK